MFDLRKTATEFIHYLPFRYLGVKRLIHEVIIHLVKVTVYTGVKVREVRMQS